jgi:uncharacterized membrane protein YeaQ/YmgE (transglycosylase-associated protein family)
MSIILYLILVIITGLIVGGLARFVLPGPDPMSLTETAAIGIAGSLIAGFVSMVLLGGRGAGLILSVAFATLLVWAVRRNELRLRVPRAPRAPRAPRR